MAYPDGSERVRFRTVIATETPAHMAELAADWRRLISILCIHPFRDGNGRVSRLLLLLQCYHLGCEAVRYISPERLIEQNKARYYETPEQSSQGWHEGRQARPLAVHQLRVVRAQDGVPGIRRARGGDQGAARRQNRPDSGCHGPIRRRIHAGSVGASLPGRQPGHDPARLARAEGSGRGRLRGARPGGPLDKDKGNCA